MTLKPVISAALILLALPSPSWLETELTGCSSPTQIAHDLAKLQGESWRRFSAERVQSIWSTSLDESSCESKNGCRFLVSRCRVINNHCECCDAFKFNVERKPDGSQSEYLDNVIIHYTTHQQKDSINAARILAEAAGLSRETLASIGKDAVKRYEWADARGHNILELQFTKIAGNWELYFSLGSDLR